MTISLVAAAGVLLAVAWVGFVTWTLRLLNSRLTIHSNWLINHSDWLINHSYWLINHRDWQNRSPRPFPGVAPHPQRALLIDLLEVHASTPWPDEPLGRYLTEVVLPGLRSLPPPNGSDQR